MLTILCFKFESNQRQKLFPLMLSVILLTYLSLYILLKIEPIAWLVNYVLVGKVSWFYSFLLFINSNFLGTVNFNLVFDLDCDFGFLFRQCLFVVNKTNNSNKKAVSSEHYFCLCDWIKI